MIRLILCEVECDERGSRPLQVEFCRERRTVPKDATVITYPLDPKARKLRILLDPREWVLDEIFGAQNLRLESSQEATTSIQSLGA